ncbi:rCG54367 [Rattus norvegicus]|uniref:RCG54367 n=1 Tax=Rattus norvegicus TaxID=10116 RepID=A6J8X7_RAT|nr:rCG54367 [Rattus norvegicus]
MQALSSPNPTDPLADGAAMEEPQSPSRETVRAWTRMTFKSIREIIKCASLLFCQQFLLLLFTFSEHRLRFIPD